MEHTEAPDTTLELKLLLMRFEAVIRRKEKVFVQPKNID